MCVDFAFPWLVVLSPSCIVCLGSFSIPPLVLWLLVLCSRSALSVFGSVPIFHGISTPLEVLNCFFRGQSPFLLTLDDWLLLSIRFLIFGLDSRESILERFFRLFLHLSVRCRCVSHGLRERRLCRVEACVLTRLQQKKGFGLMDVRQVIV